MKNKILVLLFIASACIKAQVNPSCTNMDLESMPANSYTSMPGWQISACNSQTTTTGFLCYNFNTVNTGTIAVLTTPFILGASQTPSMVPNSPLGGTQVGYINGGNGSYLTRASQFFSVTPSNSLLQVAFFTKVGNFGHPNCCDNAFWRFMLLDCSGNLISGTTTSAVTTVTSCPNTFTTGMATNTAGMVYTPNWFIRNLNLSPYIGSCVELRMEAATCSSGGHYESFYFDAQCSAGMISGNGTMTGNNFNVCNSNSATLTSITANSYTWTGPSLNSNNQTITTSTPGTYTITTGYTGAAPQTQTFNLVFGTSPAITATASSSLICAGNSSSLSASGNSVTSYQWNTGSSNPTISVTPTVSTVYTVTAYNGGCSSTATVAVNISACTGVMSQANFNAGFQLFPNPSEGNVYLKSEREIVLQLTDQAGRLVRVITLNQENKFAAVLEDLPGGFYLVAGEGVKQKLVIAR